MAAIPELKAPAKPAAPKPMPLNAKCPVDDKKSDGDFVIAVSGKILGFCSRSCLGRFNRTPAQYLGNIPELRPGGAAKKTEDKPGADPKKDEKPAATGPCDAAKTAKGMFCVKCDRELTVDDVRNKVCKRCETVPADIEYCVKRLGFEYHADCHPNKKDTKPVS